MTKEEAIKFLKVELRLWKSDCKSKHAVKDALKTAIKALEQEQQADNEWCTDCKEYDHEKHCCPRFSQVIKTTLQECCENAVSREDVLLMLTGEDLPDDASKLISIFGERIKNLPPVKPQEPRWIPVSERLPEEDGEYLLFGKIDEDEENYIFVGEYDSCGENFGIWQEQYDRSTLGCLGSEFYEYASVTAWMPLPKPYKAESESKE